MLRRITLALSLILFLFGSWLLNMSTAQAADDCTTKVLDATAAHVLGGDLSPVNAAIEKLDATGADTFVRTFDSAPGGSLEAYRDNLIRTCPNLHNAAGVMKGNLVLLTFSMDHKSAIFYGGNMTTLNSQVDTIRTSVMGGKLRSGDFPGAIIATSDALRAAATPNSAPQTTTNSSGPSIDWGAVGSTILLIVGLLAVAIAATWGVWHLTARRRERAGWLRQVNDNRAAIDTIITSFTPINREASTPKGTIPVMEQIELDGMNLADTTLAPYRKRLVAIEKKYNAATMRYAPLQAVAAQSLSLPNLIDHARKIAGIADDLKTLNRDVASVQQGVRDEAARLEPSIMQNDLARADERLASCQRLQITLESMLNATSTKQRLDELTAQRDAYPSRSPIAAARTALDELLSGADSLQHELSATIKETTQRTDRIRNTLKEIRASEHADKAGIDSDKTEQEFNNILADRSHDAETQRKKIAVLEERLAKAQRKIRKHEEESRHSSYYGGDSFNSGLMGGYLGASLGSHSGSSSSSSSSDGGSSGSWSGSGGYDGGSSGGWSDGGSSFGGGFDGGSSGGW